jgi:N utilization substance protein B
VQELTDPARALALFFEHLSRQEGEEPLDAEAQGFVENLVRGTRSHLTELDEIIARVSRNWRIERMARVDRNLLRMALYELKHSEDVPPKVVINEAIEVAKRYGTAESPAFVNGLLDRCAGEVGRAFTDEGSAE